MQFGSFRIQLDSLTCLVFQPNERFQELQSMQNMAAHMFSGVRGSEHITPAIGDIHLSSFLACNSRLHSAIHRHHPPQTAVLSQICCFWERKVVLFQILLDGAEPRDAGTT